jgi:hypothetical protein
MISEPGHEQMLALHVPPVGHACAHVPQCIALLVKSAHTPPAPPQSVCAAGHAHAPDTHIAPTAHTVPHAPQLLVSRVRSAQPLGHVTSPVAHVHAPAVQTAPGLHTCPHVPQLNMSVIVLTHVLPAVHSVGVAGGQAPQTPAVQLAWSGHAVPHAPQCAGSVWRFAHAPPQIVLGAEQQVPLAHVPPVLVQAAVSATHIVPSQQAVPVQVPPVQHG